MAQEDHKRSIGVLGALSGPRYHVRYMLDRSNCDPSSCTVGVLATILMCTCTCIYIYMYMYIYIRIQQHIVVYTKYIIISLKEVHK